MKPKLNVPAIWKDKVKHDGIDVKPYDSYVYIEKGVVIRHKGVNPVYRYAMNVGKNTYFMISEDPNADRVEKFFKSLKPIEFTGEWAYLDEEYKGI